MKILAVDDEIIALEGLVKSIKEADSSAQVFSFRFADEAIKFMEKNICDVAFLDIEMYGINGVNLANELIKINPNVNIVFSTGYGNYRDVAFDMHASGYILKPITPEKVKKELLNLRKPVKEAYKLQISVFGNFEVYFDGNPLKFKYSKSKELLAYLVDRNGALCTVSELIAVLFEEDEGHQTYFKSIRKDLIDTLTQVGCVDAIVIQHGKLGINKENVYCSYFDFLEGKIKLSDVYNGEYMTQYSFGEYTNANLYKKKTK
jgi:two-component SAPR family response regulator